MMAKTAGSTDLPSDRRTFLVGGAGLVGSAGLVGGAGLAALLQGSLDRQVDRHDGAAIDPARLVPTLVLQDPRQHASRAFASAAARPGVPIIPVEDDPTRFWFSHLRPLLERNSVVIAGMTSMTFLFCLEQFGREMRMRTHARVEHGRRRDGAIEHCLRGCAIPASISHRHWAVQMPAIVTARPGSGDGAAGTTLLTRHSSGLPIDGMLVSWAMVKGTMRGEI